jgi:hypothetical protein
MAVISEVNAKSKWFRLTEQRRQLAASNECSKTIIYRVYRKNDGSKVKGKRVLSDVSEKAGTRTGIEKVRVAWREKWEKAGKNGRKELSNL